jgi:hypothetical protein
MHFQERLALANRLYRLDNPTWQRFALAWASFNTLYNSVRGGSERWRAMQLVRQYVYHNEAQRVLDRLDGPIAYFTALTPGDMRFEPANPGVRGTSAAALRRVADQHLTPVNRLSWLVAVVYQIRCNLLHGSKDPQMNRDRALIVHSLAVLDALIPRVIRAMNRAAR